MSKFKLSEIVSEDGLIEVKVSDLERSSIYFCDIDSVLNLVKKIRRKYIINCIFMFPFLFLFLFLLYMYIKDGNSILSINFLGFLCIFLSFLFILISIFNKIRSININTYKKAQYGTVKNKYYLTHSTENNSNIHYYANVKFEFNSTFIRKVVCTKETYEKLSIGDNVLVISFDNKNAYIVISEHK